MLGDDKVRVFVKEVRAMWTTNHHGARRNSLVYFKKVRKEVTVIVTTVTHLSFKTTAAKFQLHG